MSIGLYKRIKLRILTFISLIGLSSSINAEELIPKYLQATPQTIHVTVEEELIRDEEDTSYEDLKLNPIVSQEFKPIKFEKLFFKGRIEASNYDPISLDVDFIKPLELSIEEVLEESILNNLNLSIAKLDSKIAKWQFWEKFSDNLPDFSFNFGARDLNGTFFINSGLQAPIDENIASRGIRFDYRAFNGGTTIFLTMAEKYFNEAAEDQEEEVYNFTLYESARLYNLLLNSQLQVASKLKALKSVELNLDLSKKFFNAGTGTKLDLMQAEAQVANIHKELIDAEAEFRIAEIELANHLRYPLSATIKAQDENISIYKLVPDDLDMEHFISKAKEHNPVIKRNIALKNAARNQGLSKVGDFLPKIDLYAEQAGNGPGLDELATIDTFGFLFSLEVGKNLGLGSFSNLMKSRNELKRAKLSLEKEERRIETELRTAYIRFQQAKSSILASEKELLASKEALRLSKLRYENGLEIFANLTQKESEFFESQSRYINDVTVYNLAQARIVYLMGDININDILEQTL